MPDNKVQTTAADVIGSLAAAADAARQAYNAALAANPGADLSQLYTSEMKAMRIWSDAENKALTADASEAANAQASLDALTTTVRSELSTIKNVASWATILDNLVSAATKAAGFLG